jgi:hypothetical protein
MKYLRRTTRQGLGSTIKYLRHTAIAAAGKGLGTAIKYLRRTTSAAASICLGTTIKYLRRATSGAAGNGLSRYQGLLMCPFTTSALHSPCFVRASFANKQKGAVEVRYLGVQFACVEPELSRCVHRRFSLNSTRPNQVLNLV